jgi:hypothetical protein
MFLNPGYSFEYTGGYEIGPLGSGQAACRVSPEAGPHQYCAGADPEGQPKVGLGIPNYP